MDKAEEIMDGLTKAYQETENKVFERALRENAIPPIKGEITKGKLQWRGIYIGQRSDPFERFLMQRTMQISPTIVFPELIPSKIGKELIND